MMQVEPPTPGQEIYWIAALMATALVAMFWQLVKSKDAACDAERARANRSEGQVDALLKDEAAMKDTIKEQSAIIARAVEVVQQAAAGSLAAAEASKLNTGKLDTILQRLDADAAPTRTPRGSNAR